MKKLMVLLAVAAIGFTACKKDEDPTATPQTSAEMITGSWMGDVQITNIVGLFSDTSDISYTNFKFNSDGTYTSDSAGVNPDSGTWSTPTNSTFVLDTIKFDIKLLNASNFNVGLDTTIDFLGTPLNAQILLNLKK